MGFSGEDVGTGVGAGSVAEDVGRKEAVANESNFVQSSVETKVETGLERVSLEITLGTL